MLSHGLPKAKNQTVKVPLVDFRSVKHALQAPGARFWSYEGSFTTPPCTEGVKWSVLARPLRVSARQLQVLQAAMPFNARSTAPVGKANSAAGGDHHGAAAAALMMADDSKSATSKPASSSASRAAHLTAGVGFAALMSLVWGCDYLGLGSAMLALVV
nr:hypothetical protein HK105_002386 [Polyrhizophydium stewartii]